MKTPSALTNLARQITLLNEQWGQFLETELEQRPGPGRWTKKEIVGHLIDSAANNHRRFVLAQLLKDSTPKLLPYDQNAWVRTAGYQHMPSTELLTLWTSYNRFLLHFLGQIPEPALAAECSVFNGTPITLDWLIDDYVLHLEHHVHQIITE